MSKMTQKPDWYEIAQNRCRGGSDPEIHLGRPEALPGPEVEPHLLQRRRRCVAAQLEIETNT